MKIERVLVNLSKNRKFSSVLKSFTFFIFVNSFSATKIKSNQKFFINKEKNKRVFT